MSTRVLRCVLFPSESWRRPGGLAVCLGAIPRQDPMPSPLQLTLLSSPCSSGRVSSQSSLGATLPTGFQKHRGQDIFSSQSSGIQTIRSLRPLIAQVREGKVAVQEGSCCRTGSGLLSPSCVWQAGCLRKVTPHVCAVGRRYTQAVLLSVHVTPSDHCRFIVSLCLIFWGGCGEGMSSGIYSQSCPLFFLNHTVLNFKIDSFLHSSGLRFGG